MDCRVKPGNDDLDSMRVEGRRYLGFVMTEARADSGQGVVLVRAGSPLDADERPQLRHAAG
jgi:hypothetical protein